MAGPISRAPFTIDELSAMALRQVLAILHHLHHERLARRHVDRIDERPAQRPSATMCQTG